MVWRTLTVESVWPNAGPTTIKNSEGISNREMDSMRYKTNSHRTFLQSAYRHLPTDRYRIPAGTSYSTVNVS